MAAGAASAQTAGEHKALVCIFLAGGNDHANTVVPRSVGGGVAEAETFSVERDASQASDLVDKREGAGHGLRFLNNARKRFRRALRIARRILAMPQLAKYQATEILPGPSLDSDDELRDYVKRMTSAVHHPGGSCRMGSDSDAVVDPQLRVRGVEALRVVDASIFPRMVSGNSNAGVVMVAEKAADMIQGKQAMAAIEL